MKLQQLSIGERFEYQGEIFVKSGPLTAVGEHSGQRVIPRYALLRPVGATAPVNDAAPMLPAAKVQAAFEDFYVRCQSLVTADGQAALAKAREDFLAALR